MTLSSVCSRGDDPETMYAWALQAEGLELPTGIVYIHISDALVSYTVC